MIFGSQYYNWDKGFTYDPAQSQYFSSLVSNELITFESIKQLPVIYINSGVFVVYS